jgi:multiple sugar transport system permease protein
MAITDRNPQGGRALVAEMQHLPRRSGLGGLSLMQWREALHGYAFISPWVIGFLVFTLGPMIASLYYSFADYHIQRPPVFVGLRNYIHAVSGDRLFWLAVRRTVYWSLLTVPLGIAGSLCAAILLDQGTKGTAIYRTCFFLPSLTPVIAASLLWTWILQPDVGIMNTLLAQVGIRGPRWFSSVQWAMPALAMIALWNGIGGSRMLIFLAGLQAIPESLYEAAAIDGAGFWRRHLHITLPMISPAMFFNIVLGLIGSFQVFDMAYVTTSGGPAYATHFYALHLYRQAFVSFDMGYGSALAWLLFATILLLTLLQLKLQSRWVYYEAELS